MWVKTDAGRAEMQTRSQVKERAQRNLLLLIDGKKTEAVLLQSVAGITRNDLAALHALGMIEELADAATARSGGTESRPMELTDSLPAGLTLPPAADDASLPAGTPLTYGEFTQALTQLISNHLGLRGLPLTLAVERCATIDELLAVARRVIDQIRARRGDEAARNAEVLLFRQ